MNHELIVLDTAAQVASLTARTIAGVLADRVHSDSDSGSDSDRPVAVAFSGGSTPTAMLGILAGFSDEPGLADRNGEPTLDWRRVHVFQVDERVAPAGDAARNLTQLKKTLGGSRVPGGNFHPMPVELGAEAAAESYASTLVEVLGEHPAIDVVHLGLGTDGHCASLVPGDPVLDVHDRDVAATLDYQGHRRVTLTYPAINRAGVLVWQVIGTEKAAALKRLLQGDESIPAGRVQARRSIVITDRSAAPDL